MSYAEHLKELLRPLGVYALEGSFNGAELDALGGKLDEAEAYLEKIEREMCPLSAEGEGLDRYLSLLPWRPAAETAEEMGRALSALMRIGGDSFTVKAVSDNLEGCGLPAEVKETGEQGVVEVSFPTTAGQPENLERMRRIIEDIIPCHLEVRYVFRYITWARLEEQFPTWEVLEQRMGSWDALERAL